MRSGVNSAGSRGHHFGGECRQARTISDQPQPKGQVKGEAMAGGRPTKYKRAFCDVLDSMGDEGEGVAEAIVALGIAKDTFYCWQEAHRDFSDAVKAMRARSQAWWEQKGRLATFGGVDGFNATSYIFQMKNRFRDDWNDKTQTELTGKDGGAIETKETGNGAAKLAQFLDGIEERSGATGDTPGE